MKVAATSEVLDELGDFFPSVMAILLPDPLRTPFWPSVMQTLGNGTRKEAIPLRNYKMKLVGKLEADIAMREDGGVTRVSGRIDIDTSPALRAYLLTILQGQRARVVSIDLSAVTHIDSSGVATLIEALKIARIHNAEVKLQGLDARLLRLFQSTGILSLFSGNIPIGTKAV